MHTERLTLSHQSQSRKAHTTQADPDLDVSSPEVEATLARVKTIANKLSKEEVDD